MEFHHFYVKFNYSEVKLLYFNHYPLIQFNHYPLIQFNHFDFLVEY
jgi:hypothetical protein